MDLESFCVTMASLLDFSKILLSRDVTGPAKHVHVRFRSDPSGNRDGVRARGHKDYCFYGMIAVFGEMNTWRLSFNIIVL